MSILSFPRLAIAQESAMKSQVLRLKPGQDLKVELEKFISSHGIQAASVVSAVGSLKEAKIRFANKNDATALKGPLEVVSLSGTLGPDGSHLHIAVSDGSGVTTGGHLVEGNKVFTTMELVLAVHSDLVFKRNIDPATTYKELDVKTLTH
jgi:predicted DNA-binding protein with PD1-like motif